MLLAWPLPFLSDPSNLSNLMVLLFFITRFGLPIYIDRSRAILSSVLGWVEKSDAIAFPLRGLTMNI